MDENRFSPRAQKALELAEKSASELGHSYIGSEHLLLGLLREEEGIAHRVLSEKGLSESMVRQILVNSVGRGVAGTSSDAGLDTSRQSVHFRVQWRNPCAAALDTLVQSICLWDYCGIAAVWQCVF